LDRQHRPDPKLFLTHRASRSCDAYQHLSANTTSVGGKAITLPSMILISCSGGINTLTEPSMGESGWLSPNIRARASERAMKPGETLFRAGQRTVGLFEIASGRVRLVRVDRSGREALLYTAASGDTLAEASLFSPTYHCNAIATTNAVVRLYPKAAILLEFRRRPEATEAFMARLARQVMDLRTRLEGRNMRSARDRIRHFLVLNSGEDKRTVALTGTLKELAADLGLTHEALYRTLARMVADGEIRRSSGKITLS
jgi:CRP-like cAMP-binding protein